MSWWKTTPSIRQAGSVLFHGRWVARPEDFAFLEKSGIRLGEPSRSEQGGWSLPLDHRQWGRATLVALPEAPIPPKIVVDFDARLTEDEKAAVGSCRQSLSVTAEPRTGNVLADRKDLLRFLHAALGEQGVAAVDHTAQAFWSRDALEQELSHDAELDIDGIYTLHLVSNRVPEASEGMRPYWLHSHGLREIGFHDFDVLDPAEDLGGHAHDLLRAIAFAIVERRLGADGRAFEVVVGERVQPVAARDFLGRTPSAEYLQYRSSVDDDHLDRHLVLCDAGSASWFSRLRGKNGPRSSRFLRGPFPEEVMIHFSSSATELMAKRARQMLDVFREVATEFAEFEFPAMVKLGYHVDGGGEDDREHLWFQVHRFVGNRFDATLINAPFHIARLREGVRGEHPADLMSDWVVLTPFGRIDPRQTRTLRTVRQRKSELRQMLELAKRGSN